MATYFSKCTPLIREDIARCSAMSLCNLAPTTDDLLDQIYKDGEGRWRDMEMLLDSSLMAKACQIEEVPLYDWLVANAENYGRGSLEGVKRDGRLIDYKPFVMMTREAVINNNYWKAENGVTTPGTSPNTTAFDLRLDVSSMTEIPVSLTWFPIGSVIFVSSKGSSGASTNTQWKVVDVALVGTTAIRLYLADANGGSTFPSFKLQKPTYGVVFKGVNNVNPMERYCTEIPGLNTTTASPVWLQWSRYTLCSDELTQQFMRYVAENNPLYNKFYNVPEVKRNAQILRDFQNSLAHAFLFQSAISNKQTTTDWDQLDTITSWSDSGISGSSLYWPDIEGRCVGRRANAVGLRDQLQECGQVLDLNNDVLNLPELEDILYRLHRIRSSQGDRNANLIEVYTDTWYATQIARGYFLRWKSESVDTTRTNINNTTTLATGWKFTDFELVYPRGVTLRVLSHLAFDDLLNAHKNAGPTETDLEAAGRKLIFPDWRSIHMGVFDTREVTNSSGTAQQLAAVNESALCVMEVPKRTMNLKALLWGVVVKCPQASLWIENINSGIPEWQYKVNNYEDAYGKQPGH